MAKDNLIINFSDANLRRLAITWIGNKERNEGVTLPKSTLVSVNDMAHEALVRTCFKAFEKTEAFYAFHHSEDLSLNVAYQNCMMAFDNLDALDEAAKNLSQRFYDFAGSEKIDGGEFFMAVFENVGLQGELVPAIALLKIVQKDVFLRVERAADAFALAVGEGIGAKVAFSAIIFGVDEAEGYRVVMNDNFRKKDAPSMWENRFLGIKPIENNYFNTENVIQMTGEFLTQKAPNAFGLGRTETIDMLNRSAFYFKENENFDIDDFANKIFQTPEQQAQFKEFKEEYAETTNTPLADQFDISKQAVRKTGKIFKKVIKLDANFHIYVHSRSDLIERGFDEDKGKPFYKMYFDQEE